MSLTNGFYKTIEYVSVIKTDVAKREGKRLECGIRLYSTQYGSAWELQVRGPMHLGPLGTRLGKDDVIASASLSVDEMKELRDAITALLRDCGEEQ